MTLVQSNKTSNFHYCQEEIPLQFHCHVSLLPDRHVIISGDTGPRNVLDEREWCSCNVLRILEVSAEIAYEV